MAAEPFVITTIGGEVGGGSTISAGAKEMITWYRQLRRRFQQFLEQESAGLQ